MKEYNFNETVLYIDGTRDQNLEAARRWAEEHGTTFEEDMNRRDLPKRFFVIGSEPVVEEPPEQPEPTEPTIEEKNEQICQQRQSRFATESNPLYLDYVEAQARGDETVEEKKQLWLEKKDEIRAELPYAVEVKTTTKKRKKSSVKVENDG